MAQNEATLASFLRTQWDEEEALLAEEESIRQADRLAEERSHQARVAGETEDVIRRTLGGHAPAGMNDKWKIDAIAESLKKRGITGKENIAKALRVIEIHSRKSKVPARFSRLDRVFLALRGRQF